MMSVLLFRKDIRRGSTGVTVHNMLFKGFSGTREDLCLPLIEGYLKPRERGLMRHR